MQYCTGYASQPKVTNVDKIMSAGNHAWGDLSFAGIASGKS
jgi:hypothetical protein